MRSATKTDALAERMRERRRANALSQTELAERLHVSQATISQWEKGKSVPSIDQLLKLNEVLGGGVTPTSEAVTEAESQTPIAAWLSRALARKDLTAGELAARADVSVPTVYNILGGRAQNPQPRTIEALEKALGDKFESKDTGETSEVSGIGELIDFNPYDEKELPTKAGVYVLYDISLRPIYVGKASKIAVRIKDHSSRFWFKRPLVETGAYIEIPDPLLRDQTETVLIQFLKNNAVINRQKTVREEE